MRLQHLALALRDQQRAIDFYARFFRFDPSTARTYPDGVVIVHDPDGFALALGPDDSVERGSGFPHFGFEMGSPDEVRRLRARLVADGANSSRTRTPKPTSGSSASIPTDM